jgi:hypothetical protein
MGMHADFAGHDGPVNSDTVYYGEGSQPGSISSTAHWSFICVGYPLVYIGMQITWQQVSCAWFVTHQTNSAVHTCMIVWCRIMLLVAA